MGLQDVYYVWDAWEYNQTDMLYSIIRSMQDDFFPILGALSSNITFGLDNVSDFLEDIGQDIKDGLDDLLSGLMGDLDWVLTSVLKPVWEAIQWVGSALEPAYRYIGSSILGAVEVISTDLNEIGTTIDLAIVNALEWATEKIKDLGSIIYNALADAISWCWDTFVDVVAPALFDILAAVFESEPVQWLVEFITENTQSLINWMFDIDMSELEKWAKKTASVIKGLVESEGAA